MKTKIYTISKIKRFIRSFLKLLSGKYRHLSKTININKEWYGNNYGGFYVCPEFLSQNSIIYSFGIGEDISFDKAVIKNHGCHVFGFDPTPKSINWIKHQQNLPLKFSFFDYGIANKSGLVNFFLPKNDEHVSGSYVDQANVNNNKKVLVEMKCWKDIVNKLGHAKIDVLKMDIEGAEYSVIENILESNTPIGQILIEFHERFFEDGKTKSIDVIEKLKKKGYEIFGISETYEEISFINKALLINK